MTYLPGDLVATFVRYESKPIVLIGIILEETESGFYIVYNEGTIRQIAAEYIDPICI